MTKNNSEMTHNISEWIPHKIIIFRKFGPVAGLVAPLLVYVPLKGPALSLYAFGRPFDKSRLSEGERVQRWMLLLTRRSLLIAAARSTRPVQKGFPRAPRDSPDDERTPRALGSRRHSIYENKAR